MKIEVCAAEIIFNYKPLILVSLYKPPNISVSSKEWHCFFSIYWWRYYRRCFNSHHSLWGSTLSCAEGKKLYETINDLNLQCLNNGSHTKYATPFSQSSAIDLTFSNCVASLMAHWEVLRESWGSDHFPITIELLGLVENRMRFSASCRIHSTKTDWDLVQQNLCDNLIHNLIQFNSQEIMNNQYLDIQKLNILLLWQL